MIPPTPNAPTAGPASAAAFIRFASSPPAVNHMEGVLFKLHSQICWFVLRNTTSRIRSWLERCLLCVAIACFGALVVSHLAFCHRATTGIMQQTPQQEKQSLIMNLSSICLKSIPGFSPDADVTQLTLLPPNESSYAVTLDNSDKQRMEMSDIYFSYSQVKGYVLLPPELLRKHHLSVQKVAVSKNDPHCFGEPLLQFIIWRWNLIYWGTADTVMMNWFLGLDQQAGFLYNPRTSVVHDLHRSHFGELHHQEQQVEPKLTTTTTTTESTRRETTASELVDADRKEVCRQVNGRNAHLINFVDGSISNLSCAHDKEYYNASHYESSSRYFFVPSVLLSKFTVVIKTSFLFYIATTLVSFTLRETQERMLAFTLALREHVRSRQPLALLIIRHIIENLVFCPIMVGIMFFLAEFYRGDKFLAFMVLSLVWVREVFSVISLRSQQSMHFFPRIFFLLFCLFHIYLFSYPFGFSYTALATTVCTMLHSMLFFWHRYELPAIANGFVSPERPRMFLRMAAPSMTNRRLYNNSSNNRNNNNSSSGNREEFSSRRRQPTGVQQQEQAQQRSFPSMSSLGGHISRQTSSNGLFNSGEDGDESYMYFMDGEVVMHRNGRSYQRRNSSPSGSRSSWGSHNPSRGRAEVAESSQHRVPNRIVADTSISPSTEEDCSLGDEDDDDLPNNGSLDEDEPRETSGLQAILESMQSTPLHGNLTSAAAHQSSQQLHEERALLRTAPSFPTLE